MKMCWPSDLLFSFSFDSFRSHANKAMNRASEAIKEANLKSRILLQVHDELVLEVVKEEIEKVSEILTTAMQNTASLKVPLIIDINYGKNWAEAK